LWSGNPARDFQGIAEVARAGAAGENLVLGNGATIPSHDYDVLKNAATAAGLPIPGKDFAFEEAKALLESQRELLRAVHAHFQNHNNLRPDKLKEITDSIAQLDRDTEGRT
jgi:hypothetical protein